MEVATCERCPDFAPIHASVAINYFPTEEPDAKEVIDLIKAEGRVAVAIPGDLREC